MKKLRLDIEQLNVESFASAEAPDDRGTVQGKEATLYAGCGYTNDRFDIQCRSVGVYCGPTEYYNATCVATAALCCNETGVYLCGSE
jgi:hypothetical protein